jgi:hypothetical protein
LHLLGQSGWVVKHLCQLRVGLDHLLHLRVGLHHCAQQLRVVCNLPHCSALRVTLRRHGAKVKDLAGHTVC